MRITILYTSIAIFITSAIWYCDRVHNEHIASLKGEIESVLSDCHAALQSGDIETYGSFLASDLTFEKGAPKGFLLGGINLMKKQGKLKNLGIDSTSATMQIEGDRVVYGPVIMTQGKPEIPPLAWTYTLEEREGIWLIIIATTEVVVSIEEDTTILEEDTTLSE